MTISPTLSSLPSFGLFRSVWLKPSDELDALLAKMDENRNGSSEFKELLNVIFSNYNEEIFINQDQLMQAFHLFDKDGDGSIIPHVLATIDLPRTQ